MQLEDEPEGQKEKQTVFLIETSDLSEVQGSTESYYLTKFLSERTKLHLFAPIENDIENAVIHSLPIKGVSGVFLLNVILFPYWIYQFLTKRPDIIYCYENVITPAILGRFFDTTVAFDLQSDPYEQGAEFGKVLDRGIVFSLFLMLGKYAHKVVLKQANHLFILSEPLAENIISNYGVDRDQIHIVPLGVDTSHFKPTGNSYNEISIVYLGSLEKTRGIDIVLEGLLQTSNINQNVRLDLYGDGPKKYVNDLIEKADSQPRLKVIWHGKIPHEEIPEKAGKSDFAISPLPPYDAYQVSSPAKIFEYLGLGLPIVASDIEPHRRILSEGEDALFFEPTSADELAKVISKLINDDCLHQKMSENARTKSYNYRWESRFESVETALDINTD